MLVGVCQDELPCSGPTAADLVYSAGSRRCQTFFWNVCLFGVPVMGDLLGEIQS